MAFDLVIQNGLLVSPERTVRGNLGIRGGKIAAVLSPDTPFDANEVVDAAGYHVLPGFIDTHVHSRDGVRGAHHKEDFFHSSMAGACSGVTTVYEMPNCNPAIYNVESLKSLIDCITPKAHVDFGVWGLCLGDLNNDELLPLSEAGVVGLKYFWGYAVDKASYQLIYNYTEGMENVIPPFDQGQVFNIFRHAKATGKQVAIHAENFDIIKLLTAEVASSGDRSYGAMLRARPPFSETTVIQTAISFCRETGTPLHILHLAAGDGVALIRAAQKEGLPVTAETCPHYLMLTDENAEGLGAVIKGYPPVRTKYDQDRLWEGLLDGTLNHVCSDHAPHTPEEKRLGLWEAPAGMATIETLPLLMLDAVNRGKLTLNQLARFLSENPAKLYGTFPEKGSLEIGTDADVVLVDMNKKYTFHQEDMHSRTKLSTYDGWQLMGKPVRTILRGKTMAAEGEIVGAPSGRFIRPL